MHQHYRAFILALVLSTSFFKLCTGQEIRINSIQFEGNKITRDVILRNEITFDTGATFDPIALEEECLVSRNQIFNLNLFNTVDYLVDYPNDSSANITFMLIERFYHVPSPVFLFADRSFNEWWVNNDRSTDRLIYGAYYQMYNFRGRAEKIELEFNLGFQQAIKLRYKIPALNKKRDLGLNFEGQYIRNKRLTMFTESNQLVNIEYNDFAQQQYNLLLDLNYRETLLETQTFGLLYRHINVIDSVNEVNPKYLNTGKNTLDFIALSFNYESDHRDIKIYPLRGYHWEFEAIKWGMGVFNDINYLEFTGQYSKFYDLGSKFFASGQLKGKVSFPERQPYFLQRNLGYQQNFVRGFDRYVVDGQHYAFIKLNLKYQLLQTIVSRKKTLLNNDNFNNLPIGIYPKVFMDYGIAMDKFHQEGNFLHDRGLLGWGAGIDFALPYDLTLRLEYAWNNLKNENGNFENGLFVHFVIDINPEERGLQ